MLNSILNSSNIVLVTRQINCANVSKEDFVNAVIEDMKAAYKIHYAYEKPKIDKKNEEYINSQISKIVEFANSKYKREKYKQNYIKNEISKINRNYHTLKEFSFADFNVEPDRMGIPLSCIISIHDLDRVNKCYDYVKDNEYFKKIIGWDIVYVPGQRNEFRFITDHETEKDMNNRIARFTKSVDDFYKNTSYWGD